MSRDRVLARHVETDGPPALADLSELGLRRYGGRTALIDGDRSLTYLELADAVAARGRELGERRRLVAVEGSRTIEFVVTFLAALDAGHPVIVVDGELGIASIHGFEPDVVVRTAAGAFEADVAGRGERAHDLHPELALLLSTSGSTGSSKLVRLSLGAVRSNAAAIAASLRLGSDDVGITSLPLQYCYGLSIVTSHLAVGASVVLTEASVVDACFSDAMCRHGVTGLAGVPHTFELIERDGDRLLGSARLRYVTQAGGRLGADGVRRLAEVGRANGFELFVM
ncbi:MAG: AMP-binding protein, partial [Ilumatobacter sp.]